MTLGGSTTGRTPPTLVGAVREGRRLRPTGGCRLLLQAREDPAQVVEQQVGEVVGEAVAHHDAQRGDVLPVLRERVRGHEPTLLAQPGGDVEYGEGLLAVDHEREDGQ